jgi:hypothetical protein
LAASGFGTSLAAGMNAALAFRLAGEVGVSTFDIFGLARRLRSIRPHLDLLT